MIRCFVLLLALLAATPVLATEAGWALLRNGGHVVLLRHANAPGSGDPASFEIDDCRTQRNLSERGRLQARRIGALFAARAAPVTEVFSSRYCRCLDTAKEAFGPSSVEQLAALDAGAGDGAIARIIALVAEYTGSGNIVLVTHQETIETLTGIRAREGEAVVVGRGKDDARLAVLGRIVFN